MDKVTLTDVGLDGYDLSSVEDSVCMSISATQHFDISLFIVPVGQAMPLHDHPNMAVLTKLLSGEALCTSFTPLHSLPPLHNSSSPVTTASPISPSLNSSSQQDPKSAVQLAPGPFFSREVQTKDVQSGAWFLTPSHGNLHTIHALKPSTTTDSAAAEVSVSVSEAPVVMLDILLPPYDFPARPCRYYSATSHPLWIPTVAVTAHPSGGGGGGGENDGAPLEHESETVYKWRPGVEENEEAQAQEEWPWKKWVVEEIEEPTEALPYGVVYTGDVPV